MPTRERVNIRILILTQYYPPEVGATQVRLSNLARTLTNQGHQVAVLTAMPHHPEGRIAPDYRRRFRSKEIIDGIPIYRNWLYPAKEAGLRRLLAYGTFQLSSFGPLVRLVRTWKPDFLFVESPPLFLGLSAILQKYLTGTPFIFNIADLWPDWAVEMGVIKKDGLMHKIGRSIEARIYKQSAFINVVTKNMSEVLLRNKSVPEDKLLFLPNGVDLELFNPGDGNPKGSLAKAITTLYKDKKIVLYAGTHGRYHGLETAIDAASRLHKRDDIVFLFVGDGAEKERLINYAKAKGLSNVTFRPPVQPTEVAELLQLCTVALSVIRIPTRAAKIFPAMASAKPILYAGAGEGADLVEETRSGIVVPPDDAVALARGVVQLVDQPELAHTMGVNGRKYVERHLSWELLVERWVSDIHAKISL